ncbi:hypothetical protein LOK74_12425 [Brevibacillus humidisoli]|uniref:hypothetical protein n=1 Tax=Brevibacillus humidisoli TaxID=2895522 RepID=UPI001E42581D|nr:hypothetical protein [Brevibacillus humidisoli]UFJ38891.1 hypothetical protein LOK74_12425 [Brevibacillus humidisoli]
MQTTSTRECWIIVYILGALLLLAVMASCYLAHRKWVVVYEGHLQRAHSRFTYLQAKGIRCKVKNSTDPSFYAEGMVSMEQQSTGKVSVHKGDVQRAYDLLSQYKNDVTGSAP